MPSWMKDAWEFMERKLTDKGDLPGPLKVIVEDYQKRKIAVGDLTPISPSEFITCTFLYDMLPKAKKKPQQAKEDSEQTKEDGEEEAN